MFLNLNLNSFILKAAIAIIAAGYFDGAKFKFYTMHRVGAAPGFRSPATPFQSFRKYVAVPRRPLPDRVPLGGGSFPLPGNGKARGGLVRVSAPADTILSDRCNETANVEDGDAPWVSRVSTWEIFGFFSQCIVAMACVGALVFLCHLGVAHYHNVSYITSICIIFIYCLVAFILQQCNMFICVGVSILVFDGNRQCYYRFNGGRGLGSESCL